MERLGEIAASSGGRVAGPEGTADVRPTGVSIDTRTLSPGDLFFAIKGPTHDGHRFVRDAFSKGACGVVVSEAGVMEKEWPGIVVADTTRALQDAAIARRRRMGVKVVGITGSAGKTTTKEMTRQVLSTSFKVMGSRGNLNNLYGLPLSLYALAEEHQVAVVELGISTPDEMARLAEIADPDVGILTNLHGAHLENFDGMDGYASAKAVLFESMRPNTTGIFNGDDERCRRIASSFHGYAATFGMDAPADCSATGYEGLGLDGCRFTVTCPGGSREVRLRFGGAHHAMNALAALAAGHLMGCDLKAMVEGLEMLEPLDMRGRVYDLPGEVRVLDDSYNANPGAVRAALAVLSQMPAGKGRRIAVLGDMLELGEDSEQLHREMGRLLAASGIDAAFAVGPLSAVMAGEAARAGFEAVRALKDAAEAVEVVPAEVGDGDVVLVKASRSIGLDKVVAALVAARGGAAAGGEGA